MPKDDNDILIDQGAKKASIHTVNQDIAEALSGSSAKTVSDAIHNAKKQAEFEKEKTLSSNKNKFWFGLAILTLLTATGFLIWGIQQKDYNITVDPIIVYQGLITYDQTQIIGDFEPKASLMHQKFIDAKNSTTGVGLTRYRFKNADPVNSITLIKAFEWKLSKKFTDTLGDTIDFGVYKKQTGDATSANPFILFKTDGSDQAFSSFSSWENDSLFDIGNIFEVDAKTALDPIYQKRFQNITIESHDGRVLYDASGKPLIIMIFIDESHALITNSSDAVREISKRLLLKK